LFSYSLALLGVFTNLIYRRRRSHMHLIGNLATRFIMARQPNLTAVWDGGAA